MTTFETAMQIVLNGFAIVGILTTYEWLLRRLKRTGDSA